MLNFEATIARKCEFVAERLRQSPSLIKTSYWGVLTKTKMAEVAANGCYVYKLLVWNQVYEGHKLLVPFFISS